MCVESGDEFGPTSELLEDFHDLQVNGMVKVGCAILNPKPSFLGVITHILGCKTCIRVVGWVAHCINQPGLLWVGGIFVLTIGV